MRLSTHDLKQILDAVNLLNSDHNPESLPRRTFDSVKRLIPTDVISYEAFGMDKYYQGPLWFEPTENVSNQMLATMGQYVSDHPLFIGADIREMNRATRVSDFVTLPDFKRTIIYNEFFRLLGTDRQLSAALHITPQLMISCSLCRLSRDYSDRDCAVLDLMTPHLTSAFRNAQFTKRLHQQAENMVETLFSANIGLVSLDGAMNVQAETHNAKLLLGKYFDDRQKYLPEEVSAFVRHHRSIFIDDEFYLPPPPMEKKGKHGSLIIRILFQSSTRTTLLLFEEISASMNGFMRLALTSREKEVLQWIGQGKTNAEIAELLGVSIRTIHKHVENLFNKLGVETRTAAASFLFEDLNSH